MSYEIISDEAFTQNETVYQGFNFKIGRTVWSVVVSSGKYNEVRIKKVSNNPFGTLGKFFDTFKEAIDNYKSTNMKNYLNEIKFRFEIQNDVVVD